MPSPDRDDAEGDAPRPHDAQNDSPSPAHPLPAHRHFPPGAVPPGAARLLGLDALALNMRALDGHLELLWCDPDTGGLGPSWTPCGTPSATAPPWKPPTTALL